MVFTKASKIICSEHNDKDTSKTMRKSLDDYEEHHWYLRRTKEMIFLLRVMEDDLNVKGYKSITSKMIEMILDHKQAYPH